MKIVDKIAEKAAEKKPFYSFEYFPPKTSQVSGEPTSFFSVVKANKKTKYVIFTSGPSLFSVLHHFGDRYLLSLLTVLVSGSMVGLSGFPQTPLLPPLPFFPSLP